MDPAVGPSTLDYINTAVGIAVFFVATFGFAATIATLNAARNRQRLEVEGYIRVDIGPPDGTADYLPPSDIIFVQSRYLSSVGETTEQSPIISVWYQNMQRHPLGVAVGVASKIGIALTDPDQNFHEFSQAHEIAYIEPGKTVRIDALRFPESWDALCQLEGIQYRNLHWDGSIPRHGRRECTYINGQFEMVPWSDPTTVWRDRWASLVTILRRPLNLLHPRATEPAEE
jgi:hypothetical protein